MVWELNVDAPNCLYNVYVQQEMEQGRQLPRTWFRFGLFTTPPQDEDNSSEDSEDEVNEGAPPRTVCAWGGSFAVYQSRKSRGIVTCWRP